MSTNFEKVVEFNRVFGVPVYDTPQMDIFDRLPKLVKLRVDLILEEVTELDEAIMNYDLIETIDALADILYVTYGMGVSLGINLNDCRYYYNSDIIPNSNLFGTNGDLVMLKLDLIKDKTCKLQRTVSNRNISNIREVLSDIMFIVYSLGESFGVDLNRAMDLVHQSNMSKSCNTYDEAQETIQWYNEQYETGKLPYDSASCRKSYDNKYYVVYNESTGKILKSINYNPVSFSSMLE